MHITPLGAAGGEVTGSAYLLQTGRARVLVECGLFQGSRSAENGNRLPTRSALTQLDAVVLTHAHLDHSRGSIGRALLDGAGTVRIRGQRVPVRARAHQVGGLSGHAGQADLLAWVGAMAPSRPRVLLTHGDDHARDALRAAIAARFGLSAELPADRQVIDC